MSTEVSKRDTAPIFDAETAEKVVKDAEALVGSEDDDADASSVSHAEEHRGGTAAASTNNKKPLYRVVKVIGADASKESSRFSGSSPNIAARKAARRVWKRCDKRKFDIVIRKICREKSGHAVYKYHAVVARREEPIAFFTAQAKTFTNANGSHSDKIIKRIHIVKSPACPYYGYIDADGGVVACAKSSEKQGEGKVYRVKGTNTLVMGIRSNAKFPTKVGPHKVVRDDYVVSVRKCAMSREEAESLDSNGHVSKRR